MTSLPPKLLFGTFTLNPSNPINSVWSDVRPDGNDSIPYSSNPDFAFQPYRWNAILTVNQQGHGSSATREPFIYNGNDIVVGDWMVDIIEAKAVKIVEITSQGFDTVECVLEDVDSFNLSNVDPNMGGAGIGGDGNIVVFSLGEDGLPVLAPSSAYATAFAFNPAFFQDLTSRFNYRNLSKNSVSVNQPGHGLVTGDIIYMDVDGLYKKVSAQFINRDQLERIVGQVTTSGFPSSDNFSYRPRGVLIRNIDPPLPDTQPGKLIYVDPYAPGKFTAVKPTVGATAIYVRLQDNTTGIYLQGSAGGMTGPLGYYATVYRVADIPTRDALDTVPMQIGDQVFVADTGQGDWAHFIVASKSSDPVPLITWVKMVDEDSSSVDGRSVSVTLDYTKMGATSIYRVSPTTRITTITIDVDIPFHASASLTIGDDSVNDRLADDNNVDLGTIGTYVIQPSYQYGGTEEEWIRAYLNPGTSVTGSAKITLSYM